jgi:hypothetical protein
MQNVCSVFSLKDRVCFLQYQNCTRRRASSAVRKVSLSVKTATHYYTRNRIFQFIQQYYVERGYAPSYTEIANTVGTSRSNVGYHVRALENVGRIVRQPDDRHPMVLADDSHLASSALSIPTQAVVTERIGAVQSLTPILDALVVPLPPRTWMPRRHYRPRRAP